MTKEEAGVVGGAQSGMNRSELPLLPASEYSLADLFANINPQDAEFLKYVPDGFLNDQQINAKRIAQSKERARIEGYEKKGPSCEELTNALAEDLAAENRNYLSKDEIYDALWKVVEDSTNVPEQVKR